MVVLVENDARKQSVGIHRKGPTLLVPGLNLDRLRSGYVRVDRGDAQASLIVVRLFHARPENRGIDKDPRPVAVNVGDKDSLELPNLNAGQTNPARPMHLLNHRIRKPQHFTVNVGDLLGLLAKQRIRVKNELKIHG